MLLLLLLRPCKRIFSISPNKHLTFSISFFKDVFTSLKGGGSHLGRGDVTYICAPIMTEQRPVMVKDLMKYYVKLFRDKDFAHLVMSFYE